MAATRRELLIGLGAGLVAMQGGALAADGEAIAAARRQWATVGDIERLEREIRDVNQRMQNALSRVRRTGFGPGAFQFSFTFDDTTANGFVATPGNNTLTDFLTAFPGSVIGLSVIAGTTYSGSAGSNYNVFEVYIDGVAAGLSTTVAGGSRSAYAIQDKGEDTFAAGARLQIYRTKTGTPCPSINEHVLVIWVSNT